MDGFAAPLGEHLAALRSESDRLGSRIAQFREGLPSEQLTLEASAADAPPAQEPDFVDAEVVEDDEADKHADETPALALCPACSGDGDCPRCRGHGHRFFRRCRACGGGGRCATCLGEGHVTPPADAA